MNRDSPFKDIPRELMPVLIGMFVVIFIGVLIVYILYLKNLQDLLKKVSEPNRRLAPGKVWLVLISFIGVGAMIPSFSDTPVSDSTLRIITLSQYALSLFSLVWNFYMVNKIAESVTAELVSRNRKEEQRPTYAIGMFMCACNTLALVTGLPYLAIIGLMASGAGFVAWIMYWVKTYEYKNKLQVWAAGDDLHP